MNNSEFDPARRFAETPFGRIAYVEKGSGPVALFCHGAFLNGYQWRNVIEGCAPVRRAIAFDNMGHGHTEMRRADQPLDFAAQAEMMVAFLHALDVEDVDLVGNDSGGGIAQVFTASHPDRVRTLTLIDCDAHDNILSSGFERIQSAVAGGLAAAMAQRMIDDIDFARSDAALGGTYQYPERLEPSTVKAYLAPLLRSDAQLAHFARFVMAIGPEHMLEIEDRLRALTTPTLIAWGTADQTFDVKWAYWLRDTIPGAERVVEIEGAKLFWPEERPDELAGLLIDHWTT